MSLIRWPDDIDNIRRTDCIVRKRGMVLALNNNVPEYPDNLAGTTYLQGSVRTDAWAGWNPARSTVSVLDGRLRITGNGTQTNPATTRTFTAFGTKSVRIKCRRVSGSAVTPGVILYWYTGGTSGNSSPQKNIATDGSWSILDFEVATGTNTTFEIAFIKPISTDVFELEFIYIGDGTYSSQALDLSGNGNHAQIFGATPVEGGFSFDKVNDYLRIPNFAMPDIYTFRVRFVNNVRDNTNVQIFHGYGGGPGSPRFLLFRPVGSDSLSVLWWDGSTNQTTTILNVFSNIENDIVDCVFSMNWITKVLTVSRNGLPFSTVTLTNAVKPGLNDLFLGNQFSLLSNQSFGGILQYPRIYNRALTAAEIYDLAQNPEFYEALPVSPLQGGYQESLQDGTIRSAVDSGAVKTRRRFTALSNYISATYDATDTQKQILQDFYQRITAGGSAAFDWPHPEGYEREARFVSPPSFTPNGPDYIASVQLEVLP